MRAAFAIILSLGLAPAYAAPKHVHLDVAAIARTAPSLSESAALLSGWRSDGTPRALRAPQRRAVAPSD
jgi:hypothetical protein